MTYAAVAEAADRDVDLFPHDAALPGMSAARRVSVLVGWGCSRTWLTICILFLEYVHASAPRTGKRDCDHEQLLAECILIPTLASSIG